MKNRTDSLNNKVFTDTIMEYAGKNYGNTVVWKIHSEKLVDGQPIHAMLYYNNSYSIIIGMRINAIRGRYIVLNQISGGFGEYRITGTESTGLKLVLTSFTGTEEAITIN